METVANYGLWMFLCVLCGEQDERHDYDGMDYGARPARIPLAVELTLTPGAVRAGEEAFARRDDPFGPRKIAYPPRLMVDFTSLGVRPLWGEECTNVYYG